MTSWSVVAEMLPRTGRDQRLCCEIAGEYDGLTEPVAKETFANIAQALRESPAQYRVAIYRGDELVDEKTIISVVEPAPQQDDHQRMAEVVRYLQTVRAAHRAGQPGFTAAAEVAMFDGAAVIDGQRLVIEESKRRRLTAAGLQTALVAVIDACITRLQLQARKRAAS